MDEKTGDDDDLDEDTAGEEWKTPDREPQGPRVVTALDGLFERLNGTDSPAKIAFDEMMAKAQIVRYLGETCEFLLQDKTRMPAEHALPVLMASITKDKGAVKALLKLYMTMETNRTPHANKGIIGVPSYVAWAETSLVPDENGREIAHFLREKYYSYCSTMKTKKVDWRLVGNWLKNVRKIGYHRQGNGIIYHCSTRMWDM
jgi:hypothetical protein